jgi:hypothetical protein
MEFVERILSKIVGEDISEEELELVSGGMIDTCPAIQCRTWADSINFSDCEC